MEEHTKRLLIIAGVMLIIWFSLLTFWWIKADEVTRHPCSICAKLQGEKVLCTSGTYLLSTQTFYPNGTIDTYVPAER